MKDSKAKAVKDISGDEDKKYIEDYTQKKECMSQILREKDSESPTSVLEHLSSNCKQERKSRESPLVSDATVSSLVKNFNTDMHTLIQQMLKEKISLHAQNLQLWKIIDKQRAMILELQRDLEKAFKEKKKYYGLWNTLSERCTLNSAKTVDIALERMSRLDEESSLSLKTPEHKKSSSVPTESRSSDIEKSELVLLFPGDKDFSVLNTSENIFSSTLKSYAFNENKTLPLRPSKRSQQSIITSDKSNLEQFSEKSFLISKGYKSNILHDQLNLEIPSPTIYSKETPTYRECSIIERSFNDRVQNLNKDLNSSFDKKIPPIKRDEISWNLESSSNNEAVSNYIESPLPVHFGSQKIISPTFTEGSAISSNISQNCMINLEDELQIPSSEKLSSLDQDLHNKYNTKSLSKNIEINKSKGNAQLKHESSRAHESDLCSNFSSNSLSKTELKTQLNIHDDYLDKMDETSNTVALNQENITDSVHYSLKSSPSSPCDISSINLRILNSKLRMGKNKEEIFFSIGVFQNSNKKELWRIEKSIQKILSFDSKLRRAIPFWKIPDITCLTTQNTARVDQRKALLDQYLKYILSIPLDESVCLLLNDFLNTDIETQTKPHIPYNKQNTTDQEHSNEHSTKSSSLIKKEGYLTKRGKNFGGWKSRYFVLDGPVLKYYETYGGSQLGTIRLSQAQIGRQQLQTHSKSLPSESHLDTSYDDNSYRHAFLILEPKRNYSSSFIRHVLCAKSDKDCDEWVEALTQYIDSNNADKFTASIGNEKKERKLFFGKSSVLTDILPNNELKNISESTETNIKKQIESNSFEHHSSSSPNDDMGKNISIDFTTSPVPNNLFDSKMTHKAANSLSNIKPFSSNSGDISEESLRLDKKYKKKGFWGFVNKDTRLRLSEPVSQELRVSSGSIDLSSHISNQSFRNIFGAPLSEAVSISQLSLGVDILVPSVVYRCIEYLDNNNAEKEEGIYRLSGSNTIIKSLRDKFNTVGDVNLVNSGKSYDIHAIAGLLKLYLRELPTNILTRDLHAQFLSVMEIQDNDEKVISLNKLIHCLPEENFSLLHILINHLYRIVAHSDLNKMTSHNMGIVFSPTLNIPAGIFSMLLIYYDTIFGNQPNTPVTEHSLN
ncbi:hypothetical protein PORY_001222 [Pneumocystis oryctolagi]|uniref:Uncharacterized protein n=1 Tax=Pneumocystis oryctolagi TaxID=42067 RepID=A0ACB7CDN2_9ASCO|nr:hypothetical protein PORY_001222 [Pneumocystis oryctolagi]